MSASEIEELHRRIDQLERRLASSAAKTNNFIENLTLNGLEHFRKFYGVYRAKVVSNKDPEKRGRIQVLVPEVGQTEPLTHWIDPLFDYAGSGVGTFFPPEETIPDPNDSSKEIPSIVRVFFDKGNPSAPIGYLGGWNPEGKVPTALGHDTGGDAETGTAPIKRGIQTKAGHFLVFDDKAGEEKIQITWSKADGKNAGELGSKTSSITLDPDGNIVLVDAEKTTMTLDAKNKQFTLVDVSGNKITTKDKLIQIEDKNSNLINIADGKIQITAKDQVTIKTKLVDVQADTIKLAGEADKVPLGQKVLDLYTSHTHPTGVGPSGPPIQPAIASDLLSQKVKLS